MKKLIDSIKKMLGMKDKTSDSSESSKGFTLIELLVVIAVIGVLAAAILIAIDPIQQLARGRDSGRKTTISQLGNAMQSYLSSNSDSAATLPTAAQWTAATNILVSSGDLKLFPSTPGGTGIACTSNSKNNFCYAPAGNDFVIYTGLESKSEWQKCGVAATNAWYTYLSTTGKAGVTCGAANPTTASSQL